MTFKAMKIAFAALILQALLFGPARAQDFDSLVSSAASANQRWLQQTDLALGAGDESTFRARTAAAVATGEQVESLLRQALALAPDDASRSRVSGLLDHVTAALQSGRAALQNRDFNQARSLVDAMRGEVNEALSELVPFAKQPPPELPAAGELPGISMPVGLMAALLAVAGTLATLAGLGLRRRFA